MADAKSEVEAPPSEPSSSIHSEPVPMDAKPSTAGPIPQQPPPVPPLPGLCTLSTRCAVLSLVLPASVDPQLHP